MIGPEGYSETTRLPSLSRLRGMDACTSDGDKIGKVTRRLPRRRRAPRALPGRLDRMAVGGSAVVPVDDVTYVDDGEEAYIVVPYSVEHLKRAPAFDDDDEVTRRARAGDLRPLLPRRLLGRGARRDQGAADPARADARIAEAEVVDAIRRGDDPAGVRVKRWGA